MFGDRGKGSLALESMIPVGSPHAFDETLFSKDMLRSPVRGFGDRHAVPFSHAVHHARCVGGLFASSATITARRLP